MKKYNIGLDIGTNSVGWAVVESGQQKIIRKGNQKLWGVRLFEDANSAEERRISRGTRRRYDRRRYRIKLLQEEFRNEIENVDKNFYQILKETFYNKNDLKNKTIKLNNEEQDFFNNYQKSYPTIYHLRSVLINENKKFDIRLVYLAIHHIIKYRGNFNVQGDFNIENLNIKEVFLNIIELTNSFSENINCIDELDFNTLEKILLMISKNDRKVELTKFFNFMPKEFINEFIKMLDGNKFNFLKMFQLKIDNENVELSFSTSEYDDNYEKYENTLNDKIELLDELKNLYDIIYLKKIFKGNSNANISDLMIRNYNKHKEDLYNLKKTLKNDSKVYKLIFKTPKSADKKNYCLYDKYITNNITYEEFQKELIKYLDKFNNDMLYDNIVNDLQNGLFLPRITTVENGKFPYQINKSELIKIIENQGKYYKFLLEKVDNDYKILRLLEFRIPYYVGPLTSSNKSNYSWMIRKNNDVITPYNFDDVVDKEASAEIFIKKMISNCTYLLNEKVIPSYSILYSKFKVLNELKQIKINDLHISIELQLQIYNDLFLKNKGTITDKKFKEYLYANKVTDIYGDDLEIKGYSSDGKFANNMDSYIDFFGDNGIFTNTNYSIDDAEKIIEWVTIFEDKSILKIKLNSEYPLLNNNTLNRILKLKYKGWSNLSKKLLTEILYFDKETNTSKSIMDLMIETKENFMQILNNKKYKFLDKIDEINGKNIEGKISYNLVKDLVTSPLTKRGIYQALKIVDEIVKYMGYPPENISIEMARSNEKKERTVDRKKYLINLYEKSKEGINEYNNLNKELKNNEIDSDKLFLYFIQEGKSLYSMTPLDINKLDDYEVDHIIPRTLVKDDSIDNKALVLKDENQNKSSSFVLPDSYRNDVNKKWWKHLLDINLISSKKYNNLIRKEFNSKDIEGFINRQIVETRQITKHVANILANIYKNTKIIYLKANLSHNYREKFELYKFRDINDYHHAFDAYLASVLGEYKEYYLRKNINFDLLKNLNTSLKNKGDNKSIKYGYVINSLDDEMNELINNIVPVEINEDTGEVITKEFDSKIFNKNVENTYYSSDILVSKKTEIKTGKFYNQTILKKAKDGIQIKKNLPTEMYGRYTRYNPSYAIMVTYLKKEKVLKRMIGMPIYILETSKKDESIKLEYICKLLKLHNDDKIMKISKPIPFYSLLNWDGQICYLVGASDTAEVVNAKEFKFSKEILTQYKYALNKLFNNNKMDISDENYNLSLNEIIKYIVDKMEKEYKLYSNLIDELKKIVNYYDLNQNSIENKEKIIIELFKLLKPNSTNANFKFLDSKYSSAFGKKNGRIIESTKIINTSYAGIKKVENEF